MPSHIMRIRMWAWVVVWACSEPAASGYVSDKLRVGVNATFCEHMGSTLFCNYETTDKMVFMVEELDSSVQKVFVYNAAKLQLSETVCVSVMFNNVADVEVVKGEGEPCGPHLEFSARHSNLDRLPSQVSRIYMEDSTITTLATTANISQLIVINSVIKVFDVSSPLQPGVSVDLVSSTLQALQNLYVTKGSDLLLHKSSVGVVAYHGLIIEGNVVLRESTTTASEEDSVLMLPGATLTLNTYSGSLRVKATSLDSYGEGQHMTQSPSETSYFKAFVACLMLLFLACLVIIFCGIYIYKFTDKKSVFSLICKNAAKSIDLSERDSELPLIGGQVCAASTQVTPEDISSNILANISEKWLEKLDSLNMEILTSLNKEQSDYREKIESFQKNRKKNRKEIGEPERRNRYKNDENIKPDEKKIEERITEAEKCLKLAKEDLEKVEKQMLKNTENIELRQDLEQYMDEHVQKMCNIAGQVLDLWKRSLKSDWSSFFIFEPNKWLSMCESLLKKQENNWKVYVEEQNDIYKERSKGLHEKFIMELKELNEKFVKELKELNDNFKDDANIITWPFKRQKLKNEKKLKYLNEIKNERCRVSHTLLSMETLNIDHEKLQDSRDNVLTAATENFTQEMQRQLEALLNMHKLCVLFTRQEMNKMCDETTETIDPQSCTNAQLCSNTQSDTNSQVFSHRKVTETEPVVNDAGDCILL